MTQQFKLISGIDLTSDERTRNLHRSECRAHAAKISHQRRRAAKVELNRNTLDTVPVSSYGQGRDRLQAHIPHTTSYSPANYSPEMPQENGLFYTSTKSVLHSGVDDEAEQAEEITDHGLASQWQPIWMSSIQEPANQVYSVFDQDYQKRAFYIWNVAFSDRAAKFGVYCVYVFMRMIPQLAMDSPMVRHMVLAHALATEHWRADSSHANLLPYDALYHYTQGLRAMYKTKCDTHEFLATIVLAFLLEVGQNKHPEAKQHVKGYEEAMAQYRGLHNVEYQMLMGCFLTMRTYSELWALGQQPGQTQGSWSVTEARRIIARIMNEAETCIYERAPLQLQRIKVELGRFMNAEPYKMHDVDVNQEALLLLLHATVAILPSDIAGWLSDNQVYHLLSMAEAYLKQGIRMEESEAEELFTTLDMFAEFVLRNVLEEQCQKRAALLLQAIDSEKLRRL